MSHHECLSLQAKNIIAAHVQGDKRKIFEHFVIISDSLKSKLLHQILGHFWKMSMFQRKYRNSTVKRLIHFELEMSSPDLSKSDVPQFCSDQY